MLYLAETGFKVVKKKKKTLSLIPYWPPPKLYVDKCKCVKYVVKH